MPSNLLQTNASEASDVMFVEYSKRQITQGDISAAVLPKMMVAENIAIYNQVIVTPSNNGPEVKREQ